MGMQSEVKVANLHILAILLPSPPLVPLRTSRCTSFPLMNLGNLSATKLFRNRAWCRSAAVNALSLCIPRLHADRNCQNISFLQGTWLNLPSRHLLQATCKVRQRASAGAKSQWGNVWIALNPVITNGVPVFCRHWTLFEASDRLGQGSSTCTAAF